MEVDWLDLWLPALVAAVVTLAIEYAAKPRLEARKERLLTQHRLRQELLAAVRSVSWNLGTFYDFQPDGRRPERSRAFFREERERMSEELRQHSLDIVRLAGLIESKDSLLPQVLSSTAGNLRVLSYTGDELVARDDIEIRVGACLFLLNYKRWPPRGRKRRREVAGWYASTRGDDVTRDTEPASV